ncbi:uncharacterized protein B0P05DRAFT_124799 [Gilbertella persicaria]|uniref:uncharacterized protein n=1 Tax=Gilbertella persicaria TaxID=101096 RepID=UPI00221E66EB|nr:uncharacterized protein B0P05DRAFT_124799 [Gilbertella persicaria]KAI8077254.1 hypothetical protein B0P05DRAFT_124799 [Gilbertella persicaria]
MLNHIKHYLYKNHKEQDEPNWQQQRNHHVRNWLSGLSKSNSENPSFWNKSQQQRQYMQDQAKLFHHDLHRQRSLSSLIHQGNYRRQRSLSLPGRYPQQEQYHFLRDNVRNQFVYPLVNAATDAMMHYGHPYYYQQNMYDGYYQYPPYYYQPDAYYHRHHASYPQTSLYRS